MAGGEEDFENLAYQQRLKAAVHYTVGQICKEIGQNKDMQFSKQVIAVLAETTYKYSHTVATDLELFARHAKRCVINADDVKILVRKSPQLYEHIKELSEQLSHENQEKKARTKKGQQKKKSTAGAKGKPSNGQETVEDQ